jgi:hypothetical protein
MTTNWIDVVDTALKIGLGSLISMISGYLVLLKSQQHEASKDAIVRFYALQEERKQKYVELMSLGCLLSQDTPPSTKTIGSKEYIEFTSVHNQIQIIANNPIRTTAYNYYSSVNEYIHCGSSQIQREDRKEYIRRINDTLGEFQLMANETVNISHQAAINSSSQSGSIIRCFKCVIEHLKHNK